MINVLIVDDDAMVAELNRLYVARVPGFRCSGSASTLSQAQEMINDPRQEIDLVLLDVYMQQDSGLDLLPTIRESGRAIDVIMITSGGGCRHGTDRDALRGGRLPDQTLPVSAL
ncbi:fumarate respiration transcriptional regulator DcuR [Klebsiella pneumoniae subsp. ozaenae]|uniref:Fumarate respiration transcriptional regulator DcuR n=1 Tax=Klebsiella pneumoniae subsp. ozaenae TaxID=574 RepID=A0A378B1G2_KLEPO|nr:fumarate respiration transcriptional regulator DcuR [Klebsiella pneumoniae subsp. ozaenae]